MPKNEAVYAPAELFECDCGRQIPVFMTPYTRSPWEAWPVCYCGARHHVTVAADGERTVARIEKPEVPHAGE